ncbi:hypothetical protein [Pseudomonas shirazensis]|uniref:hypothetical protein n=1 Tax=Pseudomonas shirazensis TaxID=2745494 RepID=UPI001645BEBA|nr:hypothetical protein [Pseudomonas shirazensis]MBV4500413.1 hypothetical protein [Pseudomonas shirazensis]
MRSPHVLIDQQLDAMTHPGTPTSYSMIISHQLTAMLGDGRITIEEFNHYCGRLNRIVDGRKEVA